MTISAAEPDDFVELAARRRMSFQRSPEAVSPRGLFDAVEPAGRFRFLVAAVVAFSGRGFHATTTRDIAAVAEASPASLYTYYDTKSELLHEMSSITFRYVIDLLRDIIDGGKQPVETISTIVREYLRFHAEEKTVVLVVNRDYRALGLGQLAELMGMADEIHQLVESVIVSGIERGDFRVPDVHTATRAVLRLADVSPWFNERSSRTLEELADHHVGLILQMLGRVTAD